MPRRASGVASRRGSFDYAAASFCEAVAPLTMTGRFYNRLDSSRIARGAPMLLHGIFPPITTPFYPDGNVYFKKLESNVERYSRTPVAGIVVLGSTGEAILLSDQERREVFKAARDAAAPNKVLVAGTGIESAIETLRLTEYAAELGYDVAMVRTPHYYKKQMQTANILAFYRTVADRSPLPVIIYNFPQAVVGNIAYNAAQGSLTCNNGIDIYEPVQSDALPGTHIYLAGNFSFGNFDPNPCAGIQPGDGEGITLDTFDGVDTGMPFPYAAQAVVENNILVANGGRGLLVGDNGTGTPPFAQIYLRHNTMWGN